MGEEKFISAETLIDRLVDAHPEMWGDMSSFGKRLTGQRLGRMLVNAFKIRSGRPDANGPRGYLRTSIGTAFRRLGLDLPQRPAEPAEPADAELDTAADLLADMLGAESIVDQPPSCRTCHEPHPAWILATRDGQCIICHQRQAAS